MLSKLDQKRISFIIYRIFLYIGTLLFLLGLVQDNQNYIRISFGLLFLAIIFKLDVK